MFEDLSPGEWLVRRDSGELWQLLDVREPWEIEIASVSGAIHIPMGEILQRMDELEPIRPIAVLCHAGRRSAEVAAVLAQSGFVSVVNIAGGIDAWSQEVDSTIPRY